MGHPSNPFHSVMLQYGFLAAPRISKERTVVGVTEWGLCVVVVGGCFHSDTKAMKRLDHWSVQWVTVVCICVHADSLLELDTVEPFMIYYLAPSGLHS